MATKSDWRQHTLPDGRQVEFLDAVYMGEADSGVRLLVTLTVDGVVQEVPVVVGPDDVRRG